MSDVDGFTSPEEISRILNSAVSTGAEVYCEFTPSGGSPQSVELEIRGLSGTNVVLGLKKKAGAPAQLLTSVFKSGLTAGDSIEVVFSLIDGQYAIRDIVQDVSLATFTISAGRNLLRLQRRKDFRVSVRNDGLKFVWNPTPGSAKYERTFAVLDLSAGGMRVLWSQEAGAIPPLGRILKGVLHLQAKASSEAAGGDTLPEKKVEVEVKLVKDHGLDVPSKTGSLHALSFQFLGLSQEDSRAILFTCLFIHRNSYGPR